MVFRMWRPWEDFARGWRGEPISRSMHENRKEEAYHGLEKDKGIWQRRRDIQNYAHASGAEKGIPLFDPFAYVSQVSSEARYQAEQTGAEERRAERRAERSRG